MTQDDRQKAYFAAPEPIQHCYSSLDAARLNKAIQEKFHLTATQFDSFLELSGDTILGFYQMKDLPGLLQKETGLSADAAQRVVANLAELLSPVLERERMLANPKLEEVKALHEQFAASAGNAKSPATEPMPSDTEETMHAVTPMRTMAGDMNRIHGYGAYRQINPAEPSTDAVVRAQPQEAILDSTEPRTATPNPGQ